MVIGTSHPTQSTFWDSKHQDQSSISLYLIHVLQLKSKSWFVQHRTLETRRTFHIRDGALRFIHMEEVVKNESYKINVLSIGEKLHKARCTR